MFKADINFQSSQKETESIERMNGWVDTMADPRKLANYQATDTSNLIFTESGYRKRPGLIRYCPFDSFGTWECVLAIWENNGRLYKVVYISGTTKLQYSDGSSDWADVTGSSLSYNPIFSLITNKGISSSSTATGTITSATNRSITVSGTLTENAYVWKFIKITSGTWSGQVFMITVNTTTEIFIEWVLDSIPVSSDSYAIYDTTDCLYVAGNQAYRKYFYNEAISPFISSKSFYSLEWHKWRLWWTTLGGKIWYSSYWTGDYFWPDNYIPVGSTNNVPVIKSLWDRLVIYADDRYDLYGDNPDNFQLVKRGDKTIVNEPIYGWHTMVANSAASQYFLSVQWLESLNTIENSNPDTSFPVSSNIMDKNRFGKYSKVEVFDNRVYVFDSASEFSTTPKRAWVYDIELSIARQYPVWSVIDLPKWVSAVFYEQKNNRLYIWYDGVISYFNPDYSYDWDNNIACSYTSWRRLQAKRFREKKKKYHRYHERFRVSGSGTITVDVSIEWWAFSTLCSKTYNSWTPIEIELNCAMNKKWRDIKYKISTTATDWIFESISQDTAFEIYPEPNLHGY